MHPSDTLVLGPLPLLGRSLRLPLGVTLGGLLALLVASATSVLVGSGPLATSAATLAARLPIALPGLTPAPTPVAAGATILVSSMPAGAAILLDGHVVGETPATVVIPPGHSLVLRRPNATDVTVMDPGADLDIPVWQASAEVPVRAPLPGGAVTDVQVLGDGRVAVAVASTAAPNERQAWLLDPAWAHLERVRPAMRDDVTPAGIVVAPDGQHTVVLVRGVASVASSPTTADVLLVDGPEGRRPLLPDGLLARDERVRDLSWAPDSRAALLVTQRPMAGSSSGAVRLRLRHVSLSGGVHDLVELPVAPLEGSWVWAADAHAVAFLVRTTPPVLATLELAEGALRSVADVPAEVLPSAGAVAPAAWAADGTLLFAAPTPEDRLPAEPASTPAPGSGRPPVRSRLQALGPGRIDPRPLGDARVLSVAPAIGPGGTLLVLDRAPYDRLVLRTLDLNGHPVAEQSLGVSASSQLAVRWDLAHAELVLLQAAAAGGIDARVLRLDDGSSETPS